MGVLLNSIKPCFNWKASLHFPIIWSKLKADAHSLIRSLISVPGNQNSLSLLCRDSFANCTQFQRFWKENLSMQSVNCHSVNNCLNIPHHRAASYLKKIKLWHSEKQNKYSTARLRGCAPQATGASPASSSSSSSHVPTMTAAGCAEQGQSSTHVVGGVPPGVTLPLDAALLQPPLAFGCALHALPARSRWRQRLRHRPRRWDGERPCWYTCSYIIQGFGGSSRLILSTEINKQLPWKVMCDLRKTGEVCRSGTLQQEKARLPTPACSFLGQPRLTQEKEQHHSQSCHALVQVRKTETMKIKNATSDDSRLIRKSHVWKIIQAGELVASSFTVWAKPAWAQCW